MDIGGSSVDQCPDSLYQTERNHMTGPILFYRAHFESRLVNFSWIVESSHVTVVSNKPTQIKINKWSGRFNFVYGHHIS